MKANSAAAATKGTNSGNTNRQRSSVLSDLSSASASARSSASIRLGNTLPAG